MDQRTQSNQFLVFILVLIGLVALGFFVYWLPQHRTQQRASNERNAETSLKTLSAAEHDFRENDRDGNGEKDYWTGDVAGLFRFGLIERNVAEADPNAISPLTTNPVPFAGYYIVALNFDDSETPSEPYQQDTDKKSGKVHHRNKFGFAAYPANPGVTGNYVFIVNQNNTMVRKKISEGPPPKYWPSDAEFRNWNKYQ